MDKTQLPARVRAVIERVDAGQKLCRSLRLKATGETEVTFTYEPSGKRAGPRAAEDAIKSGLLRPLCDGLFEPEFSQTWGAQ